MALGAQTLDECELCEQIETLAYRCRHKIACPSMASTPTKANHADSVHFLFRLSLILASVAPSGNRRAIRRGRKRLRRGVIFIIGADRDGP